MTRLYWTVFGFARLQLTVSNALDGRITRYGLCMLLSYEIDGNITLPVYCVAADPKCKPFISCSISVLIHLRRSAIELPTCHDLANTCVPSDDRTTHNTFLFARARLRLPCFPESPDVKSCVSKLVPVPAKPFAPRAQPASKDSQVFLVVRLRKTTFRLPHPPVSHIFV